MQTLSNHLKDFSWKTFLKKEGKNFILLTLGSLLAALAVNMFFIPFQLTMGGISGLALIMVHLVPFLPLTIGAWIFIFNLPIFYLSYRQFGKLFTFKSFIGTFFFSACIDLTAPFFTPLASELTRGADPDFLLISLVGGAAFGIGLAIIFIAGFTTGGTDVVAFLIKQKIKGLSTGVIIYIIDFLIISSNFILLENQATISPLRLGLYSFLALGITAKSIDFILEGLNVIRAAYIISDKAEEIAQKVLSELDRGITGLNGKGMYTKAEKTVLLCVLSTKEIIALKKLVSDIDPQAFVIVSPAHEVLGEGFESSHHF